MAVAGNRLQNMLQSAVQSVQWTYSLFWQFCPQQGMLIWGDGYYNGAIKTRKTIQAMEVTAEEASLERSQQLRELYDSLSAGDTNNQAAKRPCAALSPEDLTESEWFYLMCVSFSFPPGCGLPGKAYEGRQHVWLTGANESDSKTFSRAILAKSARVQTVVCIPMLDGVVEFGTMERVEEDIGFVQHVKTFFTDHHPTKPALSGHSTSNPAHRFHHPVMYVAGDPPVNAGQDSHNNKDDDEEVEEAELDLEAETGQLAAAGAEPSELIMQLEMSEDIRLGSPDDVSNNLDSEFHMMGLRQQRRAESLRDESTRRLSVAQPPSGGGQNERLASGFSQLDELSQEDTHYSQTVSTILQNMPSRWALAQSAAFSAQSAFAKWTILSDHHRRLPTAKGTSQCLLKYILFTLPLLHNKSRNETNSSKLSQDDINEASTKIRRSASQDGLSANHVLAERRRREKLNERFIVLRSLVPFVTKMDKASILGDTIEYLKHLRKKIQNLEMSNRRMDTNQRSRSAEPQSVTVDPGHTRAGQPGFEKRKLRVVEGSDGKAKLVEAPDVGPAPTAGTSVEVSIIESDALVEIHSPYRDGLLLDIMEMLRELRVEITTVQSSMSNGNFQVELRAKVKENGNGKKASIVEVKRAIHQIIPQTIAE